ncbi:MAG: non-ribosomal peptide synthetase, partial [bacterium]|nr:non-ribosomal peptide synthetase [bacterium]
IDSDFFQIGGHSLKATVMVARIHKKFNIKLPLTGIFRNSSIRTLAHNLKGLTEDKYAPIKQVEKKAFYILSPAQKRLYFLQQMELESTAYNMPYVFPLTEILSLEKTGDTFRKLIRRHESLRTSFHMLNPVTPGRVPVTPEGVIPVQVVQNNVAFEIEKFKIGKYENDEREENSLMRIQQEFFRPFDLTVAPLLRVGIVETAGTDMNTKTAKPTSDSHEGIMLIDMHHIITDATSQDVLIKEYIALNNGENLPPLKLQYKNYAEWQNSAKQKQLLKQQETFWMNRFSNEIPVLYLPTDYPRPVIRSFEGNNISFVLNKNETANLKETAKKNKSTLYMTILAIFSILLSKLSSQEDIIVGTPVAGRRHADLENIIGMFVNTLAMRNYPDGRKTFKEYLNEVKENTLQVFENQDYQFEDL